MCKDQSTDAVSQRCNWLMRMKSLSSPPCGQSKMQSKLFWFKVFCLLLIKELFLVESKGYNPRITRIKDLLEKEI